MKKRVGIVICAVALLGFVATAHAASDTLFEGMVQKLWRGVVNTLTGWVEFPTQIVKGYNEGFMGYEDQKILGGVAGVLDGICHSAGRTISGIADIAGFWAADPETNEGIGLPLDAEYAWEEGEPYDLFDPDFAEATVTPIGAKLLRGAGNILLGVVEVPGQIAKGINEQAPDLGIVKGVWYFLSREVAGATDIATIILPVPVETKALPFDEEYPWDAMVDVLEE